MSLDVMTFVVLRYRFASNSRCAGYRPRVYMKCGVLVALDVLRRQHTIVLGNSADPDLVVDVEADE